MQRQIKSVLRYFGVGLFIAGAACMPFPVTNPEAITSIFPWLATTGALVKFAAIAMAAGAMFFGLSFALRTQE